MGIGMSRSHQDLRCSSIELEVRTKMAREKSLRRISSCTWDGIVQGLVVDTVLVLAAIIHTVQHILHDFMIGGKLMLQAVKEKYV